MTNPEGDPLTVPRPRPVTIGGTARPPQPKTDHRSPYIKHKPAPAPIGCTCGGHIGVHSTVGCMVPECPCTLGTTRDLYTRTVQ